MANANQVIVNGETILDLRSDTVTPETLQKGSTAHDKSGTKITGTLEVSSSGGTYYVELDGSFPNYTLSETTPLADIVAAYNDGKALFCRCSMGVYTATLPLFVPMPAMNTWIFSGSGGVAGMNFPAQYFTIAVTAQGVSAENVQLATQTSVDDMLTTSNIVTSVSSASTDGEVPSAKCLYDLVGDITAQIDAM